ncbi:MAG: alpha/beta hydrolase-fold protein [Pirellulaceae bacterium]
MFALLITASLVCQTEANSPVPGKQVAQTATIRLTADDGSTRETKLHYLLFLPVGYSADEAQKWPLLLFLHGSGERGDDLELVKKHGPPKLVETKPDFPFVVVSPQCPKETRWNPHELAKLVDSLSNTLRIDKTRRYVTGLSMGGSGSWSLLAEYPGLFAAAVPICGRGETAAVEKMTKTPLWVFIGAKDKPELVAANESLVAALKKAGGNVQYTVYPEVGHDSWTQTYDDPRVWQWLLGQSSAAENK